MFESLLQDIRYATRALLAKPGFAAAALVTLALAIGANTLVFSLVDALYLAPLPYRDDARLVGHRRCGGLGLDLRQRRARLREFDAGCLGASVLGRALPLATLAVGAGMQGFGLHFSCFDDDLRHAAQRLRQGLRQRGQRALGLQVFETRWQRQAQHATAIGDEGGVGGQFTRRAGQAAGRNQVQPLFGTFQHVHRAVTALDGG